MAVSATHNGWEWDAGNARLNMYYRGTRIAHIDATGLSLLTGLTHTLAGTLTVSGNPTFSGTVDLSGAAVTLPTRTAIINLDEYFKGADGADLALSETAGDFFRDAASGKWNITGEATINETEVSVGLFSFTLPENYVAGGTITLTADAFVTVAGDAVLNVASTIDMTAQKVTVTTGAVGSDLVTTAATAIAAAGAAYAFVVTPTGLVAGDKLNCSLTTSIVEDAAGTGAATSGIARLTATVQVNK